MTDIYYVSGNLTPCCLDTPQSPCTNGESLHGRWVPGLAVSPHQTLWLPLHVCALHRDRVSPADILRCLTRPQAYALGQLLPRNRPPGGFPIGTRVVFIERGVVPLVIQEQLDAIR